MNRSKPALATALFLVACASFALAADAKAQGSALRGIYENSDGKTLVEFLPDGKAYFSFHGLTQPCKHRQSGKKIVLTCVGDDVNFTLENDGALTGPPESFVGRLKKKP